MARMKFQRWLWLPVALLPALLYAFFRWFEQSQVYAPSRALTGKATDLGRPVEDIYFKAEDGVQLNGWFFAAAPDSPRATRVILHLHGNAGNIGSRLETYRALLETGVNLFAIDYRGYGRSQGSPSEEGTYRDAQAAWRWLGAKGFAPSDIIVFGESLGGGVAAGLACRETIGGLILESTFASIPQIGTELYPWLPVNLVASIRYDTKSKLPSIHAPVLVMHSRADHLIGFHHAQQNFEAAHQPKWLWELAGDHNDILLDGKEKYLAGVEKFLQNLEKAGAEER